MTQRYVSTGKMKKPLLGVIPAAVLQVLLGLSSLDLVDENVARVVCVCVCVCVRACVCACVRVCKLVGIWVWSWNLSFTWVMTKWYNILLLEVLFWRRSHPMITGCTLVYKSLLSKVGRLVQESKLFWSKCARNKTMEKVMFITWCLNYYFICWNFCDVILLCCALYRRVLCKHVHPFTLSWPFRHQKWHQNLFWNVKYTLCSVQK
jgi:hypothetical protein